MIAVRYHQRHLDAGSMEHAQAAVANVGVGEDHRSHDTSARARSGTAPTAAVLACSTALMR